MTSKPILFSGPMVRAILDGRKSQTRRVLKHQPVWREAGDGLAAAWQWSGTHGYFDAYSDQQFIDIFSESGFAPYALGDLLWVRETWAARLDIWNAEKGGCHHWYTVRYAADGGVQNWPTGNPSPKLLPKLNDPEDAWVSVSHPSIHMPRWASRLTLEVTDVRLERVQDISAEDAQAEGVPTTTVEQTFVKCFRDTDERAAERIKRFRKLWDSLNAKRGYDWDVNPWVCAVTFKAHHCNIDSYCGASRP